MILFKVKKSLEKKMITDSKIKFMKDEIESYDRPVSYARFN